MLQTKVSGDWTFLNERRQNAAAPFERPEGQQILAQGGVRSRNSARRPGFRSRQVSPSPPKTSISWKSWGERAGVRGVDPVRSRKSRFVPRDISRTTKRETRQSASNRPPLPASPPESPQGGRFGGEEKMVGTLTQGGARGSCPPLAMGYFLPPFTGLSKEAATSCRCSFKNVQSPGAAARHIPS